MNAVVQQMSTTLSNDKALLASLGYKQELKREFSKLEVFGVVFSINAIIPSIASVLVYALPNGGPVAMVWGWATCSFFLIFIAMAIAELGSSAPTAGGLYLWTFVYSSERYRYLLSWLVGYSNTIAYIAGTAGLEWGCAVEIMAAVSIGSDMTFAPTTGQIYGVFCALLLFHAIVSSLSTRIIARIQNMYIAANLLLILAVIIIMPAATPKEFKNPAKFALGGFQNLSGWSDGFAFVLSFLAPLWTIGGFDSSLHISEEAKNANVAVPWAVISATIVGTVLGWGVNMALAFNMGNDSATLLASPIGQPLATIFYNSLGKRGTLAIWSCIITVQIFGGLSFLTVASRQSWAFSRDNVLPFSSFLYRINRHSGTPVNCVWFTALCAALLGLLAFAGPVAISAVFTLGVVAQYFSYMVSISARFLGGKSFKPGPFYLGVFSMPVAIIAVAWMAFALVVLLFPASPQPTTGNMNYTVVVFGGALALSTFYYYFPKYGGVHWFRGPVANIDKDDNSLSEKDGDM